MKNLPPIQTTEQVYYENIMRYNTVHIKRYQLAMNYMDETSRVLDYGCGAGYGSFLMSGESKEVFSVDDDLTAINYAKEFYYRKNITYLRLNHPPSDWIFNTIVAFEVIEHVEYPEKLMSQFNELLSHEGILILSVPNEDLLPHAQSSNHFHHKHYRPADLGELILDAGFKLQEQFTQLIKSKPEIVPGWFGSTLIAVCKKV